MESMRDLGKYTWQQTQLINGYRIMGLSLAADLANTPLGDELVTLLHDTPLGYEGVVRRYFTGSGRDTRTLVEGPFIRAFEHTAQCTDEEKDFLARVRELGNAGAANTTVLGEFQEWVGTRIPFMASGFKRFVLDSPDVARLSAEERARNSKEGKRLWREKNPDKFAQIQRQGTQAAAEVARPREIAGELRVQMQAWFDRGFDYETVVGLLAGIGFSTSIQGLKRIVGRYDDLHYTPNDLRRRQREGFLKATGKIFNLRGSRSLTVEIMQDLGYPPGTTNEALLKLGLRERIDWRQDVWVDGQRAKLDELVLPFIRGSNPSINNEYQLFMDYLQQKSINVDISPGSYRGLRRRILEDIADIDQFNLWVIGFRSSVLESAEPGRVGDLTADSQVTSAVVIPSIPWEETSPDIQQILRKQWKVAFLDESKHVTISLYPTRLFLRLESPSIISDIDPIGEYRAEEEGVMLPTSDHDPYAAFVPKGNWIIIKLPISEERAINVPLENIAKKFTGKLDPDADIFPAGWYERIQSTLPHLQDLLILIKQFRTRAKIKNWE